jgi:AAA+ superfamily predicted ATPase
MAVEARLANAPVTDPDAFACPVEPWMERFELDEQTRAFAWACIVVAVDPMMYPHVATVTGADGRRGLTPAAFAALTGVDEATAIDIAYWLASEPTIVRFGLLEKDPSGFIPTATPYRASKSLLTHALGTPLEPLVGRVLEVPALPRHDDAQTSAVAAMARSLAANRLVVVEGPQGVGRCSAVAICGADRHTTAIALDASRLAFDDLEHAVRELCAEAMLRQAIPVIADLDRLPTREHDRVLVAPLVARLLDDVRGPAVVTSSTPGLELPTARPIDRVTMPLADVATRLQLWTDAIGERVADGHALRDVALRHRLAAGQIFDAARSAMQCSSNGVVASSDIIHGIRSTLADRFGSFVERLTVTDDWSDMVLSPETMDQLQALISRVQHAWRVFEDWSFPRQTARGGGVAALFSGPPGTGKTMVAGIIARELGRDLYRVDLSQIISKWVGETEKQLGQVFDAAESGNALLLFDEADSLFAKRTEVKSSSDRYANLEVNYLLQRIETFGGMTILTTNLDTSIDPALRRRLAAHVVFWPPEQEERTMLWSRFLSTRAPIEGEIDHEQLADEYPDMTGANIRNAALAAAFLAARENGAITSDRVHRAARAEYRAMGRVLGGRK